ncbi:hypothetical protein ETB97_010599 [Aspergillus alliaceus]|uniref:Uncharacterized protein n=1 Tax=Petromyces alliaceus TaxID=209559 RepID=A0A8H6A9R9_PETAA|nr:hypothetical protein ETB97_010599 [Aspergillus burnettii]
MPKSISTSAPPYIITIRNSLHPISLSRGSISPVRSRQYFVSSPVHPLAHPRHGILNESWPAPVSPTLFSQTGFRPSASDELNGKLNNDHKLPDGRVLKLGRRNVKLQILSERIVRAGTVLDQEQDNNNDYGDERLVVRWKTEPRREDRHSETLAATRPTTDKDHAASQRNSHVSSSKNGVNKGLSVLLGGDAPIFPLSKEEQFTGLFIFSFDEEGRITSHTIEHADNATGWERTAKFVTLTDWLIGKARGSLEPAPGPDLAMQGCQGYHCHPRDKYSSRRRS